MTWADLGLGKLDPGIQQVLFVREPSQPSQEGQTEGRSEGRHRASGKGRQARVLPFCLQRLPGEGPSALGACYEKWISQAAAPPQVI